MIGWCALAKDETGRVAPLRGRAPSSRADEMLTGWRHHLGSAADLS
ncbi:hypothetical protein ACFPM0_36810 [Pseudonocardia sulfidoxydans]